MRWKVCLREGGGRAAVVLAAGLLDSFPRGCLEGGTTG
jgi:hypothetical protein